VQRKKSILISKESEISENLLQFMYSN